FQHFNRVGNILRWSFFSGMCHGKQACLFRLLEDT
ncbi:hypothetical protein D043_2811B, partial [Vibrio parahaemolyticus EKP-021]